MSKVAIQGNASGTGTFTIAAPNSNTDRTLTLPDEAGTVLTSGGAIDVNASAPADSVTIDASGNLGVGTTSDGSTGHFKNATGNATLKVEGGTTAGNDAYTNIEIGNTTGTSGVFFSDTTNGVGRITYEHNGDYMRMYTASTERMRIASNGYLKCQGVYDQSAADSANVVVDGSGNIYRSTSALKYKQDVRDLESIDISTFRPIRYKSNIERDDQTLDHFGFIADEFHDAGLTELVSYGAVDEETGVAEVEGFRYDRMTAVLTKSLQDALGRIETLETTVADLQTRVTALEATP
jgi:hypothetical protein